MTDAQTHAQNTHAQTRSVVMERDLPHKPEKVWRAITTPALIEDWLMKTDFAPEVGRKFTLSMEAQQGWDGVIHCKLLEFEPTSHLRYVWSSMGLDTVVDFTLTPTTTGTHLRVEQSGFPAEGGDQYFNGAKWGWTNFLNKLDTVVERA
jgi:uncharacterized protein YndB with AHSA1/START domain